MRDINRIEPMLELVRKLWIAYPDLRLGQLIYCAAIKYCAAGIAGWGSKDIFHIEDDQLAHGIKLLKEGAHNEANTQKKKNEQT